LGLDPRFRSDTQVVWLKGKRWKLAPAAHRGELGFQGLESLDLPGCTRPAAEERDGKENREGDCGGGWETGHHDSKATADEAVEPARGAKGSAHHTIRARLAVGGSTRQRIRRMASTAQAITRTNSTRKDKLRKCFWGTKSKL
jgi:hypothetical protein